MIDDYYKTMYELEDNYWWFVALRNFVDSYLKLQNQNKETLDILDAGCGTGALLQKISKSHNAIGIDISQHNLSYCKKRSLKNILKGSVSHLPFKDNKFDLITSLDVLCCLQASDDVNALREFYRVLKFDGTLILNLPAFEFLRSEHDKATNLRTRYSRNNLQQKLRLAGFKISRITYRNTFLFPLVMIYRLMKKNLKAAGESESDLKPIPNFVNNALIELLKVENLLLKKLNLPFGSSVFSAAFKTRELL